MTIKLNGALRRCLAGSVLGALIAVAFVPTAMAQWMPPWGAAFPGEIERSLEAQGYVLTAPLMRRPGSISPTSAPAPRAISVSSSTPEADKSLSAFPPQVETGDPRLPPATKSLASLSRVSDHRWARASPARPPQDRLTAAQRTSIFPRPSARTGSGKRGPEAKPKAKSAATERKATLNPPLPPPAPRETARADGSGSPALQPTENHNSEQPRIDSHSTDIGNGPRPPRPRLKARPPRRATSRR